MIVVCFWGRRKTWCARLAFGEEEKHGAEQYY
jgi:hypothetical protein